MSAEAPEPSLRELRDIEGLRSAARARIGREQFDFLDAGVGDEFTRFRNPRAFDWVTLRPASATVDASRVDLSTRLLGQSMSTPILVSPMSGVYIYDDGAREAFRGATAARTTMALSHYAPPPAEVVDAAPGVLWAQIYPSGISEENRTYIEDATRAGCAAVVLTVDSPYIPPIARSMRTPPEPWHRFRTVRRWGKAILGRKARSEKIPHPYRLHPMSPGNDWTVVDRCRSYTDLPVVVKGLLTAEDAELAIEHGAHALVVSNHGGRTQDGYPATLEVLSEIVAGVAGRVPVLLDSGIRSGSDVLKALALGAQGVLIGRPVLWGLASYGEAGVRRVLEIIQAELTEAIAGAGVTDIASVSSDLVEVDLP